MESQIGLWDSGSGSIREYQPAGSKGHWEGDTVVGKRDGKEAVVLSLLEKKTENYIAIRIPGKDADSVLNAMQSLREEFGDKFSQVFKTITVDNGSEFSAFTQVGNWGCAVCFAHPYTSWERPQNERHNGLFRAFVPKGASIDDFSAEYILAAADELNGRPRKKLGYRTRRNCLTSSSTLFTQPKAAAASPKTEASGFHPDRRSDSLSSTVQVSNLHLQFAIVIFYSRQYHICLLKYASILLR